MKILITILIFNLYTICQVPYRPPPDKCYEINKMRIGQNIELISSILGIKTKIKKDNDILFFKNIIMYFNKEVLWRIEFKNTYLLCNYDDEYVYKDKDIKVYFDGKNTSVTDMFLYYNVLINNRRKNEQF